MQTFTTDFTFQLVDAQADGFTFVIQNAGPNAVGGSGGGLGYLGITHSVAVKFDLYNNAGEGPDSTGLYTDGDAPMVPVINLTGTPINLHSGDPFAAHITYDGTDLTLTLTDSSTLGTWSYSWPIDIPTTVGGTTAYVGFTGGTGALTSTQNITSWTYFPSLSTANYPAGFDGAGLALNGATYAGTSLQLTTGGLNQAATAFYATPLSIQSFTTDFTFHLGDAQADGFTFVIQNAGPTALGADGGGLGFLGIPHSVAVKFDLHNNAGEGPDSTGLFTDGAAPTVPDINLTGTPINLHSGDPIAAHITYDGTDLTLTLTDSSTLGTWSYSWPINIPSTVGGNTAYVGFTAGTGSETAIQSITSWKYLPTPSTPNYPAGFDGAGLDLNGATTYSGTALQLTNGSNNEASSAFSAAPLNIRSFTTDFAFQLVNPQADGFTFVIQNAGPTALGAAAEGLGFWGIPHSVAIKFDIYNNVGEGAESTGLYTDGVAPTVPAVSLTGTPINLHSGDPIAAHITYDGTDLTLTLTDSSTLGTWSYSWPINIPATVGGNTAYVGFTAGTGGETATQNVLSWTYLVP